MDGVRAKLSWWARAALLAAMRALLLPVLSLYVNIALFVLAVLAIAFTPLGVGLFAVPAVTAGVRRLANFHRRIAGDWSDVPIPVPYRPAPGFAAGPWRNTWRRYRWVVSDPATWRDLLWLFLEIPVGTVLGLLPACLIVYGLEGFLPISMIAAQSGSRGFGYGIVWPIDSFGKALLAPPQGALLLLACLPLCPWILRLHARFAHSLLAPTRADVLVRRVRQLTETRADTVDAQAAELRRIERDLHDGTQARLVALGMSIGLAEQLMTRDPAAAQRLLAEAREASGQALVELRGLVRGIHPPVLAERGLDGAVRALALALPIPVEVTIELPGRPQPPLESAAYFAVAEALANVTKHSRAARAWVRLSHGPDRLVIVIGDDGVGGATPAAGTGLRGIERRLAAFDGTMTVVSPPGGPTVVTLELPCELSSPKTSPSSGTG